MISLSGYWFDGRTSRQTDAVCRVYDNGTVRIEDPGGGLILSLARFDLRVSPRLADTPRYLYFPGGEKFETLENDIVDRLLKQQNRSSWLGLVHQLESRKRYVLISLLVMFLFLWLAGTYGVPAAAKVIAFHLPHRVSAMAGKQTLDTLDRTAFKPTGLDKAVRARLQDHFRPLVTEHSDLNLRIVFRKGGRIGPNAFALPGGTIVFTDEMVALAERDDELLAILAHETGHVANRHGMRRVIQGSLLTFALLALTGDVSGTSELFYGMPVMLTELAYSRGFEEEADRYALAYLRSHGISPANFARILRRIEKEEKGGAGHPKGSWWGYLSTHPMTDPRLKAFEKESTGRPDKE